MYRVKINFTLISAFMISCASIFSNNHGCWLLTSRPSVFGFSFHKSLFMLHETHHATTIRLDLLYTEFYYDYYYLITDCRP
ncbi:hypothetical protein T4D_7896 [Trichinella pseudospiralis]|uniref:Uncharacterized protein n=1 Tax=Trichinella pseudospiralis TaxID=6337 RepID=A0A0V1FR48_TRIPS|nr:hypothetical protein T4D_7896 [Trichinella pseudospiralis]